MTLSFNSAMSNIEFIQCTGEPVQPPSARIPPAHWEERKAQIASLYESFTLDEVVEKMTEAGFKAEYAELLDILWNKHHDSNPFQSRRKYIYQLKKWDISKYNVNRSKSSDTKDASDNNRKCADAWAAQDDDQLNSSSSQTNSSYKRGKMENPFTIALDEDPNGAEVAMPDFERPALTNPVGVVARTESNTRLMSPSYLEATRSLTNFAEEFWSSVMNSKSNWYAGQGNSQIAHEVSWLAKKARESQESVWRHALTGGLLYLKDIGEYLHGIKQGNEAFDIYAVVLDFYPKADPMKQHMEELLSCVRSADSPEAFQWVASYLQSLDVALEISEVTCDVLILARLFLARKYVRHGSHDEAEKHAAEARRLRGITHPLRNSPEPEFRSSRGRPVPEYCSYSTFNTVQCELLSEFHDTFDVANTSYRAVMEHTQSKGKRTYSSLSSDMAGLKSDLFRYCNVIMEHRLSAVASLKEAGEEKEEEIDQLTLSATFFRLIWRTQFDELPDHVESVWSKKTWKSFHEELLPHFVSVCCDLLAHEVKQRQRGGTTKDRAFWKDCSCDPDLADIVSRMDASKLHHQFVNCYCDRELDSSLTLLPFGIQHVDLYSLRPDRVHTLMKYKSLLTTSKSRPGYHSSFTNLIQRSVAGIRSRGIDVPDKSSDMDIPISSQQHAREASKMMKTHLDPMLRSSCRSSLSSFRYFKEARSAMVRSGTQADQCLPVGGAEGSLPSDVPGIEQLRLSMDSISLVSLRSA